MSTREQTWSIFMYITISVKDVAADVVLVGSDRFKSLA